MKKDPKQALAVNAHHAACRRHNPLMWQAWQGSDRTVINGLMGLKLRLLPAWAKMMQGRDLTNAFSDIAAGAQQAGLHQMAIFSAMLATDHRGKYAEGYHALIAKSLRALAAGKPTEALLEAIVKPGRKLFSPAKHEKPAQPK